MNVAAVAGLRGGPAALVELKSLSMPTFVQDARLAVSQHFPDDVKQLVLVGVARQGHSEQCASTRAFDVHETTIPPLRKYAKSSQEIDEMLGSNQGRRWQSRDVGADQNTEGHDRKRVVAFSVRGYIQRLTMTMSNVATSPADKAPATPVSALSRLSRRSISPSRR